MKFDPEKEHQLVAAIIRVNNLCRELELPELYSMDACKVILEASHSATLKYVHDFIEDLAPKPLTTRVQ